MTGSAYTAKLVTTDAELSDIRIHIEGKVWHLWGRMGEKRETDLSDGVPDGSLPVLIGSGLGHCLASLRERGLPVAVIDREESILTLTGVKETALAHDNILWLNDADPAAAFQRIEEWQRAHGGKPLHPVVMPLYLRLDRDYYGALAETVKAAGKTNFWNLARYPKFRSVSPKVLFFDSNYFLCDEIRGALTQLGVDHRTISLDNTETGSNEFIKTLLKTVVDFRPDFALTVNHFGLDREGKLAGLLEDLRLPLASWFVDNPHLILFDYAHPGTANTALFTFDAGNLDQLREKGFEHVHYLPLATDPNRFRPDVGNAAPANWTCDVSFVGNSMTTPVARSVELAGLPPALGAEYETVAREFGDSGQPRVDRFLAEHRPAWMTAIQAMPEREQRLACESLLTWEATRQYRLACVRETLPFAPLIVGDPGWQELLADDTSWRSLEPLDYYDDLPRFYPLSKINFNCTSRQMAGAVNQRVFDVPACGGFLITDHREQMDALFNLETEAVVYREIGEIPDLISHHLAHTDKRAKIVANARQRILAEHTYAIRLTSLLETMRATFA